jgi:hypothetical protein
MKKAHYGSGSIQARGPNSFRIRYRIDKERFRKDHPRIA